MFIDILYIVFGLIFLALSADKFIDASSNLSLRFGIPPLIIGMVIVGFGTSAPEMIVSAFAALDGSPGIALGNAYGSNIANIGLVLGITAFFFPIVISSRIVRREIPLFIFALLVSLGFFYGLTLSKFEATIMIAFIILIVVFNTFYKGENDSYEAEINSDLESNLENTTKEPLVKTIIQLVLGLAILLISSNYLVKGAASIATSLGISELVIGLTIIAIGTSLPELAASIIAAKKGESDIVLGNIIGSCLFNTFAVVGIAGVIKPLSIEPVFLYRDFTTTLFLAVLLWSFAFGLKNKAKIGRKKGIILLTTYIGYSLYLVKDSLS